MSDHDPARRFFLKSSAVGLAAGLAPEWLRARAAEAASAGVLDRLGVALYTVRDQMQADAAGTLKAIAGLGYRYIESGLRPPLHAAPQAAPLRQARAPPTPRLLP